MKTNNKKGHDLEHAVQAIEAVILESSPNLREQDFTIVARKIVIVAGVRHEIDIHVSVSVAKGYESVFIFECKNWDETVVGKNEIIIFSEKIRASSAQHGYFVAKSFTKDAVAQAKNDPRMTLLIATEHGPTTTITPESFHITAPSSRSLRVTFRPQGSQGKNPLPIDLEGKHALLNGDEILLTDYLDGWTQELYEERLLTFSTATLPNGVYPMTATAERSFQPRECSIDSQYMEHVRMDVDYGVIVIHPAVISHYEVATRGRVVRLETVTVNNLKIDTSFVMTQKEE